MKILEKKHSLAIRWFHWINFPVLATMVWSGMLIFWANHEGAITAFGKQVFPTWFFAPTIPKWVPFGTIENDGHKVLWHLDFRLAEGMGWHFTFAWFFAINGVLYVLYLIFSGEWRQIVPGLKSFRRAILVALHDLRLAKKPPQDGKYNDAQRVAYSVVIVMGAIMLLSGFAIYKPTQAFWLTNLLGGYVMAKWFHFWTTMLLCGFFLVHVAQVAKAGWNQFRGMITGYTVERIEQTAVPGPAASVEGEQASA